MTIRQWTDGENSGTGNNNINNKNGTEHDSDPRERLTRS